MALAFALTVACAVDASGEVEPDSSTPQDIADSEAAGDSAASVADTGCAKAPFLGDVSGADLLADDSSSVDDAEFTIWGGIPSRLFGRNAKLGAGTDAGDAILTVSTTYWSSEWDPDYGHLYVYELPASGDFDFELVTRVDALGGSFMGATAAAEDFNSDGWLDLLFPGAAGAGPGGLILGPLVGVYDSTEMVSVGVQPAGAYRGEWDEYLQTDIDGDGLSDVLLGNEDAWGWSGGALGKETSPVTEPFFHFAAESEDRIVFGAGDLTGDGVIDLALATVDHESRIHLVAGPVLGELDASDALAILTDDGSTGANYAGSALAVADVNGDGLDDLVVAADGRPDIHGVSEGRSAIFVLSSPISSGDLECFPDRILGPSDSAFAETLAAADLDGDGAAEVVVGSPQDPRTPEGGYDDEPHGSTWVFSGPIHGSNDPAEFAFGLRIDAGAAGGWLGTGLDVRAAVDGAGGALVSCADGATSPDGVPRVGACYLFEY